MKSTIFFGFFLMLFLLACNKKDKPPDDFQIGKNYFTLEVDGVIREYYVHVPEEYDADTPTPVVFMLHAATGSGEEKYINSGWKEVGEEENILTVFPTALVYCYTSAFGVTKNATRWVSLPPKVDWCPGQTFKDDVKFLRQVIAALEQRFNVNPNRIYLVGFSSGGQMAFRCAVEMSDLLAAVVQTGSTHPIDTTFTPKRKLPVSFLLGNRDETWFGYGGSFPLSLFDSALVNFPPLQNIINVHASSFDFETNYTMSGDTNSMLTATFKGIPDIDNRQFNFSLVKGLDHSYPNGTNHPLNGARLHWDWMKQYVKN